MSFFQSEKSLYGRDYSSHSIKPTDAEYEDVYRSLKYNLPGAKQKVLTFRSKYLSYVSETGKKIDMVKMFQKLALLTDQTNFEIGMQLMKDCLIWYPGQHWVMSRYTMLLENGGMFQQAGNNYWRLLRKYPENPHAYTQLGNFLLKHHYFNLALLVYQLVARNFPSDSVAHNCLADVYLKSGHFEKAIQLYKESVRKYPQNPVSITGLADAYLKNLRYEDSVTVYKTAHHLFPDDPVILSGLADAYLKGGRHKEAIEAYLKVLEANPDLIVSLSGLADAYLKADRVEEAIKTFREALAVAPENHVCLNGLGIAYVKQKKYAEAIETFRKGVQSVPHGSVCFIGLCQAYLRSGDVAMAVRSFREGLERFPENHAFYEGLAESLIHDKQYQDARRILEQAISKFHSFPQFSFLLAEVYLLSDMLSEAKSLIEDNANFFNDRLQSYSHQLLLAILENKPAAAKKALTELQTIYPNELEQKFLTDQLQSYLSADGEQETFTAEQIAQLKPIIVKTLAIDLPTMRSDLRYNNLGKGSSNSLRKYSYYNTSFADEFARYRKSCSELKTPAMIIAIFLASQEDFQSSAQVSSDFVLELLSYLPEDDYDRTLFPIVFEFLNTNEETVSPSVLEPVEAAIQSFGNKWELQVLKVLFQSMVYKSVDENLMKSIYRLHSYHSDFNDYVYAACFHFAGEAERAKSVLERLQRKLLNRSHRQKILFLFDHSKTSVKDFPDTTFPLPKIDKIKIAQNLIADFYLELYEDLNLF